MHKKFIGRFDTFLQNAKFAVKTSWQAHKVFFVGNLTLYILQGLLPLGIAFLAGSLINQIVAYISQANVSVESIYLTLTMLIIAQFAYSQSMRINQYFEQKLEYEVARALTSNLQIKFSELDHSYYEDPEFNKHFNKVVQNLYPINTFSMRLLRITASIVQIAASGVALLVLNPFIALTIILGIIPLLIVEMRASSERWKLWDAIDVDWRLRWSLNWDILNTQAITEIKMFRIFKYLNMLWRRYYDKSAGAQIEVERKVQTRQIWASVLESFVQFGVTIWLLARVLARQGFGIGDFEFYRRVISDFSNASSRLVIGLQNVAEAGLYVSDYRDLMAMKSRIKQNTVARTVREFPEIEFKNVSFKYPRSKEYVLKDLSFIIKSGEDIALVGENGAGKTTLIKLLMRFYDVTEGAILINGVNIKEIDLESWHRQVGVLFQDFNNYSYFKARRSIGLGDVSRIQEINKIKAAASEAGANAFISKLDHKYDTVLNKSYPEGTEISGGQWQRIALARAFFRNANVLILDEPTSAIDAKGEYQIFEHIRKTQAEKTTIIISHRFSTVRNAQKIYVIEDGKIKESGNHEQLMNIKKGTYKHMFELQAQGYK